jgi:hypothetical protein
MGEGAVAIGIEKPLASAQGFDKQVVEPATPIVGNDFAVAGW